MINILIVIHVIRNEAFMWCLYIKNYENEAVDVTAFRSEDIGIKIYVVISSFSFVKEKTLRRSQCFVHLLFILGNYEGIKVDILR